ncbi:efflux RND transporter periplasmic adaptor subunit [Clostridium magnum]|uniref:Multidrug resistance protein MdtA n=1 Tax=Clostridium magnum DSM 2767 TaxID=1121326 RepID=A0A161WCM1_9CLOT|nr:efflux RND transporter periplasmic adaptor subunit [Clostridium magnum]KZL89425.1 multidrug resistance protein MdtA precursor [Clostridium magnum DSM 2767]SHI20437.1 RND family efflux transporter, MFP subunit [Clostridium magnum DSM 2767]
MKFNKFNKKWIILIVIVALVGVGIAKHGKKKVPQVNKEVPNVKVQKIATQNISSEVQYASKLEGVQSVTVSPKSSGKVATVNVNVGDKVTAGQVLFTLDTSELSATLQSQQAALNVSRANVNDSILKYQQSVEKAQITYNDASSNYEKQQKLYDAGAISKQELDKAKLTLDTASLELKNAQDNLNLLQQNSGSTQAVAAVAQSQANLNSTQVQISNATIASPISGVVSAKNVDVGSIASGTSGTVTIIDISSLKAQITVPDKVIGKLQIGQTVPVVVSAAGDETINGVIDTISPDVDSKNNSYIVKVKIDNSNGNLKAGMFAKVSIPDQQKDNATIVPNEALKVENGVKYIYTVESSKIKRVVVQTGIANDKVTEITTDTVKAGTEIVTEGQSLLTDGEKVNIVK